MQSGWASNLQSSANTNAGPKQKPLRNALSKEPIMNAKTLIASALIALSTAAVPA